MSFTNKIRTEISKFLASKKAILKVIEFTAFLGSVYWIYCNPKEPEPYVTTLSLLAALLYTFHDSDNASPPDVIPYIIDLSNNKHQLVLENCGSNNAFDVSFNLKLKPDQEDPRLTGDTLESKLISEIFGNHKKQFWVGLTYATGSRFDAEWSWRDAKGVLYYRRDQIGIKS